MSLNQLKLYLARKPYCSSIISHTYISPWSEHRKLGIQVLEKLLSTAEHSLYCINCFHFWWINRASKRTFYYESVVSDFSVTANDPQLGYTSLMLQIASQSCVFICDFWMNQLSLTCVFFGKAYIIIMIMITGFRVVQKDQACIRTTFHFTLSYIC